MTTQIKYQILPGGYLSGSLQVPGDKSISHRSVMLGAIAEGITNVTGFLNGEDCLATIQVFCDLGVKIETLSSTTLKIHGVGLHGLQPAKKTLYVGNSGTSMRLLTGLLAGQSFPAELTGDESLCKRPMARVANPLIKMGAKINLRENNFPPVFIEGQQSLQGITYEMLIASAQVKSCLLLAGLYAKGETTIIEPGPSRDHTERMLASFGVNVNCEQNKIRLSGGQKLMATDIQVPGDISSAAFFMVGASIAENSDLLLTNVGINPTRTGVITILRLMGANIEINNERLQNGEPVADLRIQSANLKGIEIPVELVPLAIDEFPAIFIAAACAQGKTILRGAAELRVKESDRIQSMITGLTTLGINAVATEDGAIIAGGEMQGGRINSYGDHRIAMAFAMAGLKTKKEIEIEDCANVATSFPNFVELAQKAGVNVL